MLFGEETVRAQIGDTEIHWETIFVLHVSGDGSWDQDGNGRDAKKKDGQIWDAVWRDSWLDMRGIKKRVI